MITPYEKEVIRKVFLYSYWDLKVYRWMNRKKNSIFYPALFSGLVWGVLVLVFAEKSIAIQIWFWIFFPLVVLGGIDHQIIGFRISKTLRELKKYYAIELTKAELLEICKDVLPK